MTKSPFLVDFSLMKTMILIIAFLVTSLGAQAYETCATESLNSKENRLLLMTDDSLSPTVWTQDEAKDLSFCISPDFNNEYDKLETALRWAANEWMSVANVDFLLREDLSCETNSNVLFPVIKAPRRARYAARAFFPNYPIKKQRIQVRQQHVRNQALGEIKWLMLHELGHVLGFRHEHIHPDQGGSCPEKNGANYVDLTVYDPLSVMHYALCKDNKTKNFVLSEKDKEGAEATYPFTR